MAPEESESVEVVIGAQKAHQATTEKEPYMSGLERVVEEAAKHIRSQQMKSPVPPHFTVKGVALGASASFCELWPGIKTALDLMKQFLPFWAVWAADLLISIGDKACAAPQ